MGCCASAQASSQPKVTTKKIIYTNGQMTVNGQPVNAQMSVNGEGGGVDMGALFSQLKQMKQDPEFQKAQAEAMKQQAANQNDPKYQAAQQHAFANMANNPAGQQLMEMLQQNLAQAGVAGTDGATPKTFNFTSTTTTVNGVTTSSSTEPGPLRAFANVTVPQDQSNNNSGYASAPTTNAKSRWEQEAEFEGGAASDMFKELEKPIGQG